MLSGYLHDFNDALKAFRERFPVSVWDAAFREKLVNDFTFFSSRVENRKLEYGETISFLTGELVRKEKLASLLEIATHKKVLETLLDKYSEFELSEESIKNIHHSLMSIKYHSEPEFDLKMAGVYRNYPVEELREPFFPNKQYVPHFNIEISMASYMDSFIYKFKTIDNSRDETHLITVLAYFHNIFLNKIHPFADGNGRVCRIVMGIMMIKNGCPPIFRRIITDDDMMLYIQTIIECERTNSDLPLVNFLARGMTSYMLERLSGLAS